MADDLTQLRREKMRASAALDLESGLAKVPEHLRDGLRGYVLDGQPVGGFLTAVIENDLLNAVNLADEQSLAGLRPLMLCLYNDAPSPCWGSPDLHQAWLAQGGVAGMVRE